MQGNKYWLQILLFFLASNVFAVFAGILTNLVTADPQTLFSEKSKLLWLALGSNVFITAGVSAIGIRLQNTDHKTDLINQENKQQNRGSFQRYLSKYVSSILKKSDLEIETQTSTAELFSSLLKLEKTTILSKEVDFTNLEHLLKSKQWKNADRETLKLMLKITNREKEGWLRVQDIYLFPEREFNKIDKLWIRFSHGRFGFSIQKKLFLKFGLWTFREQVGWARSGLLVYWPNEENDDKPEILLAQYLEEVKSTGTAINPNIVRHLGQSIHLRVKFDASAPNGHLPLLWWRSYLIGLDNQHITNIKNQFKANEIYKYSNEYCHRLILSFFNK